MSFKGKYLIFRVNRCGAIPTIVENDFQMQAVLCLSESISCLRIPDRAFAHNTHHYIMSYAKRSQLRQHFHIRRFDVCDTNILKKTIFTQNNIQFPSLET
jgi:hypothetical protein